MFKLLPPLRVDPYQRRIVALVYGSFEAPCVVCGAAPTYVLVEWRAGSGLGEWEYFCLNHMTPAGHRLGRGPGT